MRYATEGKKSVSPRISLIACVGSDGSALYSLTQINTDHRVFCLYLTELVKKLSAADKDWRDNSVLLLDNASYHVCPETLSYLAWLNVEVIFSGPCKYKSIFLLNMINPIDSYSTAPAELLFAHFKQGQLNPMQEPTGKKSLDLVRKRVNEKAKTIRPANIVMFWHHCVEQLFKYLKYELN